MKKMAGKASWGLLIVVVFLGLLLAWQLKSQNADAALTRIELTNVVHDQCFSPNGDGVKDVMNFSAVFQGPPGKPVFAVLFVKKGDQWINFQIGRAVFSEAGTAEIRLNWNGKNVSGQTVADGPYALLMYYFDIPGLYNQLDNQKIEKVMEKIEQRLLQREKQEMLKRWDGEAMVDVLKPELTVTAPADNLQTYESSVQTAGTVLGADALSINQAPCVIDNNQFSKVLELAPGTNTFSYLAEDCAGNRDLVTRTIERLVDHVPPAITLLSPQEGLTYSSLPVPVSASYQDPASGIDLSTLKVLLNGSDIADSLNKTENSVAGEITDESLLNDGANTLRVEITDKAGNLGSAAVHFNFEKIAGKDKTYIYGRVLDIADSSPLNGAVITASGKEALSNEQGQWKLYFGAGGTYKIKITKSGYSEVYRKIQVDKGKEAVVDDAYLTLLDTKSTAIGPEGGTHSNGDETVEIVVPAGALSETKNIQVTRLASSIALPGELNETANLQYPISFLFCADLQPNGTTFAQAVKLRVKNTWGFAAGTQIPFAFWDKDNQTWLSEGMARVNADRSWLEADINHFSYCDINTALVVPRTAGHSDFTMDPLPECKECVASSVDAHSGSLRTDLGIPGVKVRGGETGVSLVYNSSTAYPTSILRLVNLNDSALVLRPNRTDVKVASPLFGSGGSSNGFAALGSFQFNPPGGYGAGAMLFSGAYPSGRTVKTGYQDVDLTFTNYYSGEYAFVANWGGMPTGSTGVLASEPAYLEEKQEKQVFMVSRADSPFGRGWNLAGLRRLHFEDNRAVVVSGDGGFREYERGINYADKTNGALLLTSSHTMRDAEKMFRTAALRPVKQEGCARFYFGEYIPAAGTNQYFVVDLGVERAIYTIGIEFPQYWTRINVWDFIRISTSIDNIDYQPWSQWGQPTLNNPAVTADPLDNKIHSPYMASRDERSVRYIKFELGFPSVNTVVKGSGIYRVYAIGDENGFRPLGEETWPKLYKDSGSDNYILEEFSGSKTVFDGVGAMIAEIERSGRTVNYEYNGDLLIRISYPEGVYMEFSYGSGGRLEKVKDSSGRETVINMDEAGNLLEVVYPDNEKREFTYNDRGLLLTDKKGNAEKKYTWNDDYAVLTEVELPNGGKRTLDPWVLKNVLNGRQSTPGQPIDFPTAANTMESTITFEDGRVEKSVTSSGWNWKYINDKLQEKIMYADLKNNRLPVSIERGDTGWATTDINYNDDQQAILIVGALLDNSWTQEDGSDHAPFIPGDTERSMTTKHTAITYNDQRQIASVRDYGMQKNFTYDNKGNLLQVDEPLIYNSKTTLYAYNDDGDLVKVTYPDGKVNEMVYDNRGLVTEVKNNDGTKTTLERDERGDVTAMVDEMNRRVELTRDVMGRVIREKSPGEKEVSYQWGGAGCSSCGDGSKLTRITDAAGHSWEFQYDLMGNPVKMIYPGGSFISQEYDIAGRLSKFTNKRGQEITYAYDDIGKLTKKTTPEGDIDFSYDNRDRIIEILGSDFHYKYSHGNFLTGWSPIWCSTIVKEENVNSGNWLETFTNYYGLPYQTFDNFGWRKMFIYNFSGSGGASTPVGPTPGDIYYYKRYSANSRKMNIHYTRDQGLRITHKTNSRFENEHFNYYDANGLLGVVYYRPTHAGYFPTGRLNFTRDGSGLINTIAQDLAMTVNYDPDLQISSIAHTVPQPFDESYTYDDNGNRLTSLSNSFIYDDLNKLTESSTHEYAYDADGNMTQEKNKLTGETKKYYWDSESRMIKYEHLASDISPVDTTALYKYDIYGRRMQKDVNGAITNFMWEGDNISFELDSTYQPIRKYFTENGMDDYFAHVEYSEVTNWPYVLDANYPQGWYGYIKDQVGTIYKVWDLSAKQIADNRTYDSFGNLVSQSGTTKTPLGFQGKYYDSESGLNYFYHRYYNPAIGRFTSEDPIGLNGGFNLNSFVGNSPTNYIDPKGLITPYMGPQDVPKDIILPTQISLLDILSFTWESFKSEGKREGECFWDCVKRNLDSREVSMDFENIFNVLSNVASAGSIWGFVPKQIGYRFTDFFHGGRSAYYWANQYGSGVKWATWLQAGKLGRFLSVFSTFGTSYTVTSVIYAYVRCGLGI